MEKWEEAKDLEKVVEALRNGRRVEDIFGDRVCTDGGYLCWGDRLDKVLTLPGRIFRIEVPKPEAPGCELLPHDADLIPGDFVYHNEDEVWVELGDKCDKSHDRDTWYARKKTPEEKQWTGPSVEITPELLPKFRASCEAFLGCSPHNVRCEDCPGSQLYNDSGCERNGFKGYEVCSGPTQIRTANAKRFLDEHPMPEPKSKMVRVELKPNGVGGTFCFRKSDTDCYIIYDHTSAPAILGAGGYEYEGFYGLLRNEPSLFLFDLGGGHKTMSQSATVEQIEFGRAVPVLPVAYWYFRKEG